jgi:6-phosphogluconolactonase
MQIEVFADPDGAASGAARVLAAAARDAVARSGRFAVALSGGRTPRAMLRALADEDVPWDKVHIFQTDERIAPAGDPGRNLTHIQECLLDRAAVPLDHIHAMPVEEPALKAAAVQYIRTLERVAGLPPVLDFVHLGLGSDGHTASLMPGDPAPGIADADVAITGAYEGYRRMTLTYPALNRSRRILWLATGSGKAGILARLYSGDAAIPAGRVCRDSALIVADRAAAELVRTRDGWEAKS